MMLLVSLWVTMNRPHVGHFFFLPIFFVHNGLFSAKAKKAHLACETADKHYLFPQQCLETLTHRQMDMQKFIADGCKEALLEEKRRFCFLVDKHCTFSYQLSAFHEKVNYTKHLTSCFYWIKSIFIL